VNSARQPNSPPDTLILAIDTATRSVSLALHDGQQIIAEESWLSASHHTVEVTPALQALLTRAGLHMQQVTALAVPLGPGSYTGLRIGMSLAKGIALAADPPLPLVRVPTLDIVAEAQPRTIPRLCAVMQAGRRRLNAGLYLATPTGWHAEGEPFICTWATLAGRVTAATLVAGEIDAAGRETLTASGTPVTFAPPSQNVRRAAVLAEIALRRLASGEMPDARSAAPLYLSSEPA